MCAICRCVRFTCVRLQSGQQCMHRSATLLAVDLPRLAQAAAPVYPAPCKSRAPACLSSSQVPLPGPRGHPGV